ncbi:hypothetical protein [Streptomyces sp. NPDC040750]|uniref:hypothetical protein n=1 Tax=Streptomyces sp. NPDC040750 TaxID=3154491 RepID=UPI003402D6B9
MLESDLSTTVRHVEALISERDMERSDLLNPRSLAARTALPEHTVKALLRGDAPTPDTVEERVCARVTALVESWLERHSDRRRVDLIATVSDRLSISKVWTRKLLAGKKMPSVTILHGLAEFFAVEGGEAFFTAPASEAINRVLLADLARMEDPEPADPIEALMRKYDIVKTDFRYHTGTLSRAQVAQAFEGLIRAVLELQPGWEDHNE